MLVTRKSPSFPLFLSLFPLLFFPRLWFSLSRNTTWKHVMIFTGAYTRGASVTSAVFATTSVKYISPLDSGNNVNRHDLWKANASPGLTLIYAELLSRVTPGTTLGERACKRCSTARFRNVKSTSPSFLRYNKRISISMYLHFVIKYLNLRAYKNFTAV